MPSVRGREGRQDAQSSVSAFSSGRHPAACPTRANACRGPGLRSLPSPHSISGECGPLLLDPRTLPSGFQQEGKPSPSSLHPGLKQKSQKQIYFDYV